MATAITPETSLFDAFMRRGDLFDAVVALDSSLAKFYRVLVNEETAKRLSLADTAAILGVAQKDLIDLTMGRTLSELTPNGAVPPDCDEIRQPLDGEVVDTHPFFDAGYEPLPTILDTADHIERGESFTVVAPFHPVPLRRLLEHRGFGSKAHRSEQAWSVVFSRIV